MKKPFWIIALGAVLFAASPFTLRARSVPTAPLRATTIVTFKPTPPKAGAEMQGECWTESIAAERSGAWRCMSQNRIYDPCFTVVGLSGSVICDANPVTRKPGFLMRLVHPLPAPRSGGSGAVPPWILELTDGSYCTRLTGTLPFAEGRPIPWVCSSAGQCAGKNCPAAGVFEHLKRGKVWIAQKVTYRGPFKPPTGMRVLSVTSVPVRIVWR